MRAYEAGSPAYFATRASLRLISRLLALYLPLCQQSLLNILTVSLSPCQSDIRTQRRSQAYRVFEREPGRPLPLA